MNQKQISINHEVHNIKSSYTDDLSPISIQVTNAKHHEKDFNGETFLTYQQSVMLQVHVVYSIIWEQS